MYVLKKNAYTLCKVFPWPWFLQYLQEAMQCHAVETGNCAFETIHIGPVFPLLQIQRLFFVTDRMPFDPARNQ